MNRTTSTPTPTKQNGHTHPTLGNRPRGLSPDTQSALDAFSVAVESIPNYAESRDGRLHLRRIAELVDRDSQDKRFSLRNIYFSGDY